MNLAIFFLLMGCLCTLVKLHRRKVSSRLIDSWLDVHGYSRQCARGYSQSISIWHWPIRAEVITSNSDGKFFKVKFSIGTMFGGYFNEKIKCVGIEQIDKQVLSDAPH